MSTFWGSPCSWASRGSWSRASGFGWDSRRAAVLTMGTASPSLESCWWRRRFRSGPWCLFLACSWSSPGFRGWGWGWNCSWRRQCSAKVWGCWCLGRWACRRRWSVAWAGGCFLLAFCYWCLRAHRISGVA